MELTERQADLLAEIAKASPDGEPASWRRVLDSFCARNDLSGQAIGPVIAALERRRLVHRHDGMVKLTEKGDRARVDGFIQATPNGNGHAPTPRVSGTEMYFCRGRIRVTSGGGMVAVHDMRSGEPTPVLVCSEADAIRYVPTIIDARWAASE